VIHRSGRYFDGTSSRSVEVEVRLYGDGTLTLAGAGVSLQVRSDAIRVSSRLGSTARVLALPGGARCELADDDELDRALAGHRGSDWRRRLDAFERRAPMVAAAVVLTLAALAAAVQIGVPLLADMAAGSLPPATDARLGEGALAALDETLLRASELPAERRKQLAALFVSLADRADPDARLVLRAGGGAGANAFALPGAIVVLTDEIVLLAQHDSEIAALLAHELGHVARRHALRSVLQNAGVGLLVAATLGDLSSISSLAAMLPTLLVQLQYSRRFESEADAYAVDLLAESGIEAEALAAILGRLEQAAPAGEVPAYLSTHPDTDERMTAIRRAARRRALRHPARRSRRSGLGQIARVIRNSTRSGVGRSQLQRSLSPCWLAISFTKPSLRQQTTSGNSRASETSMR
jgi:predicted Zn-dependent protease